MSETSLDELAAYVGSWPLAVELHRCGRKHGWTPRVPALQWRADDGYTDAVLCTILIDAADGSEKVVLKYLPPGPAVGISADAYAAAERDCPPAFRPHLVPRSRPSCATSDRGMLLFQQPATDDVNGCVSLATLPPDRLVEACRLIIDRLLRSWNDGIQDYPRLRVGDFLRIEVGVELSSAGSLRTWADGAGLRPDTIRWLRFSPDEPTVFPNPLTLARATSALADFHIDAMVGRRHGDLHLLNILVPQAPDGQAQLESFQIIDLDTYTPHGPLTSDPLFLLYSALARHLPGTPAEQWEPLLHWVVQPAGGQPNGVLFDLVTTAYASMETAVAGRGWSGDWERQLRLSGLAIAAHFSGFGLLSPKLRLWFFRLAAHLGCHVLKDFSVPIPADAPVLAVSFPMPDAPAAADVSGPAVTRQVGLTTRTLPVDRLVARAWRCWPTERAQAVRLLGDAVTEAKQLAGDDAGTGRVWLEALLDDATQILGRDDPATLSILHELAGWTYRSGDAVEAVALYQLAARQRARVLGEFHEDTRCSLRCSRSSVLLDAAAHQRYQAR
jgi:hypothetical protein